MSFGYFFYNNMDWIILICILLFLLYATFKYFSPYIEIIITGENTYDVYLFYSTYVGYEIKRNCYKLYSKR